MFTSTYRQNGSCGDQEGRSFPTNGLLYKLLKKCNAIMQRSTNVRKGMELKKLTNYAVNAFQRK